MKIKPILTLCALLCIGIAGTYMLGFVEAGTEPTLEGISVTVHKTPTCGCCGGYIDYLQDQGAEVTVHEAAELSGLRANRVPAQLHGCHFSEVDGYVIEGHVPAEAILALLDERPDLAGIALPGMPAGSPGMDGSKLAPFGIHAITHEGTDGGIFMTI